MDINRWKSVAVDSDSYHILQALCKHGYRKPGAMIAKLVDSEVSKVAKKNGIAHGKQRDQMLKEGKEMKR
tara:strand:- start:669 stop:878 length:210 start_codon:yes stop_codon:yes gene_type:complete